MIEEEKLSDSRPCALVVGGQTRRVLFVPKADASFSASQKEVETHLVNHLKIPRQQLQFDVIATRQVENTDQEIKVLELRYPFRYQALARDWKNKCFRSTHGSTTSAVELFLVNNGIHGPCFLDITGLDATEDEAAEPVVQAQPKEKLTTCPLEFKCASSRAIKLAIGFLPNVPAPTLMFVSTLYQKHVLVAAAIEFQGELKVQARDKNLASWLHREVERLDPDGIVLYDLNRTFAMTDASSWKSMGRMPLFTFTSSQTNPMFRRMGFCPGRLLFDLRESCNDFMTHPPPPPFLDQASKWEDTDRLFPDGKESETCAHRIVLMHSVMNNLQLQNLTHELACLAGAPWSLTLRSSKPARNEWLLLHEFHKNNVIPPDKVDKAREVKEVKAKRKYKGADTIDPKCGLYREYPIVLLDFQQQYPSVIREHKICLTSNGCILPGVMEHLMEERKKIKDMMKSETDAETKKRLDIRQKAIKLVANSMYGSLGYTLFRFYAVHLAAQVARGGVENLHRAKNIVSETRKDVDIIFGDTDSLMLYIKHKDALQVADTLVKTINQGSNVVIQVDKVYRSLLLVASKQFAGILLHSGEIEIKGLEIVKRDCCAYAKNAQMTLLRSLLVDGASSAAQIHSTLERFVADTPKTLDDMVMWSMLNKKPEDYAKSHPQPHAVVANRYRAKTQIAPQVGDLIPYVFENSTDTRAHRARHPTEISDLSTLDWDWYREFQLCNPLQRLVVSLPGKPTIDPTIFGGTKTEKAAVATVEKKTKVSKRLNDIFVLKCMVCGQLISVEESGLTCTKCPLDKQTPHRDRMYARLVNTCWLKLRTLKANDLREFTYQALDFTEEMRVIFQRNNLEFPMLLSD